ncbi:MAG: hypothetical protein KatS3mg115_2624 [Candidatus Poribacteria bacterium]|nr:MAG: hypothetical protein KatS3mg115_2624 [Candidatus Poribacteria bacterium]
MDFREVNEYLARLTQHHDPILQEMEEEARRRRFPIIGPAAGQFCYFLSRVIGARNIYEMGSGYGYSTAWFAKAVRDNGGGVVHHVVWDEELSALAREYLDRAGLGEYVRYTVGEAVSALQETDGPFDVIFCDIDKQGYPEAFRVLKPKLRPGGLVIVDNVLWHGRAWNPAETDAATQGVRKVTEMLYSDPEFVTTLAPIRDGLLVGWKIPE